MSSRLRKLVPLFDRVLIKRVKVPEATQIQGIYVPESAKTKQNPEGEVVAVGDKVSLKVGDKVLLPEYEGGKVKFDGEQFDMYREDEILCKISEQ
ncbi:hypothetical protein FDP41_011392 [Naegleria fowleri]|uniref:10 kDa chaperonin n=1 Tax=Naegleria fowleri TaxID=5763 RepID=A0A6A5C6J3_NAEFO|nr:uncharacterized protein FDP41_011392 [Naegleria fowleri]KAF0982462.1 hypothetical protein FDP41_011392 [Naegleria fowleri]